MTAGPDLRLQRAFRVLLGSIALTRLLLIPLYLTFAAGLVLIPVEDPFFPTLFGAPALFIAAFFGPLVTELAALRRPTTTRMRHAAAIETLSAAVLLTTQISFASATWVVVFWSGWILIWIAWTAARAPERVAITGPFLVQLVIAFVFLGGAVGKWTAGYWSGGPFYDLFFRDHPGLVYQQLRAHFDEAAVRAIAMWYSRLVIVIETGMAFVVFLPPRVATGVTIVAALGLWMTSFDLFEIVFPLIGLAVAGTFMACPAPAPLSSHSSGAPRALDAESGSLRA